MDLPRGLSLHFGLFLLQHRSVMFCVLVLANCYLGRKSIGTTDSLLDISPRDSICYVSWWLDVDSVLAFCPRLYMRKSHWCCWRLFVKRLSKAPSCSINISVWTNSCIYEGWSNLIEVFPQTLQGFGMGPNKVQIF